MLELAKKIFDKGYRNIQSSAPDWYANRGNQDMEVLNHILRVIIQNHDTKNFVDAFEALIDVQHADGGWGNTSYEEKSHIRVTAFSTQMLIRANNDIGGDDRFVEAIYKGLSFLKSHQREDGTWFDETWGLYDAVSVNTGTFMFARMLRGSLPEKITTFIDEPYRKGMEFVIRTQAEHGGWDYPEKYDTPVCVTAHLLQKTLSFGEAGLASSRKAMELLVKMQHPDGHYDNMNIDHTCDTIRSLMLASELLNDFSSHECIEKGFKWLVENRNDDDGWGDYAGDESNLLIICDGLDTMLKYIRYRKVYEQANQLIR